MQIIHSAPSENAANEDIENAANEDIENAADEDHENNAANEDNENDEDIDEGIQDIDEGIQDIDEGIQELQVTAGINKAPIVYVPPDHVHEENNQAATSNDIPQVTQDAENTAPRKNGGGTRKRNREEFNLQNTGPFSMLHQMAEGPRDRTRREFQAELFHVNAPKEKTNTKRKRNDKAKRNDNAPSIQRGKRSNNAQEVMIYICVS